MKQGAVEVPVSVDADFARFGDKSYAINKINSVEIKERRPHGPAGALLCGIIAVGSLVAFLSALVTQPSTATGPLMLTGFFGYMAYWSWKRSQLVEYQLFLITSSAETQALVGNDGAQIRGLRDRIERAMSGRERAA